MEPTGLLMIWIWSFRKRASRMTPRIWVWTTRGILGSLLRWGEWKDLEEKKPRLYFAHIKLEMPSRHPRWGVRQDECLQIKGELKGFQIYIFLFYLFFFFLALPKHLSSLSRDWIHAPCFGSVESPPLDHQGSPSSKFLLSTYCIPIAVITIVKVCISRTLHPSQEESH